jgi:hypothetical protein
VAAVCCVLCAKQATVVAVALPPSGLLKRSSQDSVVAARSRVAASVHFVDDPGSPQAAVPRDKVQPQVRPAISMSPAPVGKPSLFRHDVCASFTDAWYFVQLLVSVVVGTLVGASQRHIQYSLCVCVTLPRFSTDTLLVDYAQSPEEFSPPPRRIVGVRHAAARIGAAGPRRVSRDTAASEDEDASEVRSAAPSTASSAASGARTQDALCLGDDGLSSASCGASAPALRLAPSAARVARQGRGAPSGSVLSSGSSQPTVGPRASQSRRSSDGSVGSEGPSVVPSAAKSATSGLTRSQGGGPRSEPRSVASSVASAVASSVASSGMHGSKGSPPTQRRR